MTAPAKFRQADINRAFKGARAAGYIHVRVEIEPSGKLVVHASDNSPVDDGDDWRKNQPLYQER